MTDPPRDSAGNRDAKGLQRVVALLFLEELRAIGNDNRRRMDERHPGRARPTAPRTIDPAASGAATRESTSVVGSRFEPVRWIRVVSPRGAPMGKTDRTRATARP